MFSMKSNYTLPILPKLILKAKRAIRFINKNKCFHFWDFENEQNHRDQGVFQDFLCIKLIIQKILEEFSFPSDDID